VEVSQRFYTAQAANCRVVANRSNDAQVAV
jgi:hypothetical protein